MTREELKELCERATPGPWGAAGRSLRGSVSIFNSHGAIAHVRDVYSDEHQTAPHDAAFIAASRTAIPKLINEVEMLRAQLHDASTWIAAFARGANDLEGVMQSERFKGYRAALDATKE